MHEALGQGRELRDRAVPQALGAWSKSKTAYRSKITSPCPGPSGALLRKSQVSTTSVVLLTQAI